MSTAWSDKHLAYDLVNGPSGKGVDDLYTPEIAANGDATTGMDTVKAYDDLKVTAILNEIDGKDHEGKQQTQVPAIFGMNFQAVSVGQKLPKNGYKDAQGTFSDGLADNINHTDQSLGKMVAELKKNKLFDSTLIIITAKHGQSPIDPTKTQIVDKKGFGFADGVVAQLTADDVALIWLTDQSKTADAITTLTTNKKVAMVQDIYSSATTSPAWLYNDPTKDSRTPDILVQPVTGVIYTKPGKKIAEHGGGTDDDTNVALLVSYAGTTAQQMDTAVQTTQVAPTILKALGLDPTALEAVKAENTALLPGLPILDNMK
jgi:predicted AlkP superfamily pyrophosphatase or phosphodiesterase